jgi:hypothetical protein
MFVFSPNHWFPSCQHIPCWWNVPEYVSGCPDGTVHSTAPHFINSSSKRHLIRSSPASPHGSLLIGTLAWHVAGVAAICYLRHIIMIQVSCWMSCDPLIKLDNNNVCIAQQPFLRGRGVQSIHGWSSPWPVPFSDFSVWQHFHGDPYEMYYHGSRRSYDSVSQLSSRWNSGPALSGAHIHSDW